MPTLPAHVHKEVPINTCREKTYTDMQVCVNKTLYLYPSICSCTYLELPKRPLGQDLRLPFVCGPHPAQAM